MHSKTDGRARWAGVVTDLCAMTGAGLITYGAGLVYLPAGYITGGLFLLAIGIGAALRKVA